MNIIKMILGTKNARELKKLKPIVAQINRILRRNPDHPDRALLERLRDDLRDALGGN